MDDVTRGLTGRRVCGGIELVFGILLVLGYIQSFNVIFILSPLLILLTGILGIASRQRGVVIAYLVTGILCTIFLLVAIIISVVLIIAFNDKYGLDSTSAISLIAAVVIVALGLVVAILGVVFACLPFCGNGETHQRQTSQNIVKTASYNYGNTAYPATLQGPPTYNHGNTAYPVTMQGPPTYNHGNTAYPVTMQGPPTCNHGNTAYSVTMQGPPTYNHGNTAYPVTM